MLIYEVNISVTQDRSEVFEEWLDDHIEQMLCVDGFVGARIYRSEEASKERCNFVVHYDLESRDKLQHYFDGPAKELRAKGIDRFGDQLQITRRILMRV